MKKKLLAVLLLVAALVVLDRVIFIHQQVTWFNVMMIQKGTSKQTVQRLLGDYGLTLANPVEVPDPASPAGVRLLQGKAMRFQNVPPTSGERCYIGFVDELVVDKYFGPPPGEE